MLITCFVTFNTLWTKSAKRFWKLFEWQWKNNVWLWFSIDFAGTERMDEWINYRKPEEIDPRSQLQSIAHCSHCEGAAVLSLVNHCPATRKQNKKSETPSKNPGLIEVTKAFWQLVCIKGLDSMLTFKDRTHNGDPVEGTLVWLNSWQEKGCWARCTATYLTRAHNWWKFEPLKAWPVFN